MNTELNINKKTTRRDFIKILSVILLTFSFGGVSAFLNSKSTPVVSAGYGSKGYGL